MVKYRRRWRKRTRVSRAAFNKIASTYMKYKCNAATRILYSASNSSIQFEVNNTRTWDLNNIFTAASELGALKAYYGTYKVTGIAFECTPSPAGASPNPSLGQAAIAFVQTGETIVWGSLVTSPHCVILSPYETVRKYIPLKSSWYGTDIQALSSGKFVVASQNAYFSDQVWTIKVTLYITFRTAI